MTKDSLIEKLESLRQSSIELGLAAVQHNLCLDACIAIVKQHTVAPDVVERVACAITEKLHEALRILAAKGSIDELEWCFYEAAKAAIAAIGDASIRKDEGVGKLDQSPANTDMGEAPTPSPAQTSEISVLDNLEKIAAITYPHSVEQRDAFLVGAGIGIINATKPVSVAESCRIYEREITRQIDDKEDIDRPKALKAVLDAAGVKYE